ncbi:MAG: hypothetical protein ACREBG_10070 [Pyrinomonadaceae bacterium]
MNEKDTAEQGENVSKEQQEISFNYVKSNLFRVIHADGAWGGLSPRGDIHIAFYNERAAIPDFSKVVFSQSRRLVESETFEASSELVREVEVDVIVDLTTAKALRTWLDTMISALEERLKEAIAQKVKDAEETRVEK